MRKQRLSASVDVEVLAAAQSAVAEGRAVNISMWVNDALHRHVEHERRMQALGEFISVDEKENGIVSEQDMRDARRRIRARALVVRRKPRAKPRRRHRG